MADVSSRRGDFAGHPDESEMQARYSRVLGGRDVALVDGPVFLAGLYCAISPWVVDAIGTGQSDLAAHNLVLGLAIALLALGFALAPARMYGLSWAMCAMGAWLIFSPWVVGTDPTAAAIWNNILVGGVVLVLGLVCAQQVMRNRSSR
ncbi:SPW repeat protein [Streptomyces sp. ST2-7A]|uniref:SPW repeat protein n=1 Tax=Streptomyces sp. ST2-7A TaxID=2907214 RepID=UPI001F1ED230|nr:SPW repeat protein [Streptomyces sp. ST2-7A]MCE7081562.1 SPW repeat protein [Streptomyces sp. ST2-7A]